MTSGRQVPDATSIRPIAQPVDPPASYPNATVNAVRSWNPFMPVNNLATITSPDKSAAEVKLTARYYDGLGRLLQTVTRKASNDVKDIVVPMSYDALNRNTLQYLPYVQQSNDGAFKPDPFNSQRTFYQNNILQPAATGETIYYSQTNYESYPSGKAEALFAPGNSWAQTGGNKPVRQEYSLNKISDSVRIWNTSSTSIIPVNPTGLIYDAGQLYKLISTDEQGNKEITYTDKDDKVILKKTQYTDNPGTGHSGWLCTYYIYDDFNNLQFVIPPLATQKIWSNWVITSSIAAGLCYQYRYDGRNRNIVKKLPDTDSIETVYDTKNRPFLVRDGNLKNSGKWLASFFDDLNRPSITALYTTTLSRNELQSVAPTITAAGMDILNYTFYDNYTYTGKLDYLTSDIGKPKAGNNLNSVTLPTYPSSATKGLVTGTKVRVLGTSQWLVTSLYYDDKGRLIQTVADNINGGKDILTRMYDFTGRLLSTFHRQTNPRSTVTPLTTILTMIALDSSGLVKHVTKEVNEDTTNRRVILANTYNALNQLLQKRLGVNSNSQIETLNYEYNIRGWLRAINRSFTEASTPGANWFGEVINYDYGFSGIQQFNGNIAGVKWKSKSDNIARAYGYIYDRPGRLTNANFTQQNTTNSNWTKDLKDFSVSGLSYDANGNIGTLTQEGMTGTQKTTIDQLTYNYHLNSNKLSAIADTRNTASAQLGDFIDGNISGADYAWDTSGNLIKDLNKGISNITYNHLNLPETITITGKGVISFLYDANGTKLRKTITDNTIPGGKTFTTDYLTGNVYFNDSLQQIAHEEGRIRALYKIGQPLKYCYDYFVKDHIDNIRMVLTEQTDFTVYSATMETTNAIKETALFSNIEETRVAKPTGYPEDNKTNNNAFVAKTNGNQEGNKIGPSIVLRVMAGDTIQIGACAFYKSQGPNDKNTKLPEAEQILANLVQSFGGKGNTTGSHTSASNSLNTPFTEDFYNNQYQRLKQKNTYQPGRPKAYLNFILFDDQFNLVEDNSGVKQVKEAADQLQVLSQEKMVLNKTGFLYVFTSNESTLDIYFDNLTIMSTPGPLLEETHYYPFGLIMAGISSNALKGTRYVENRIKYNGMEHTTELGLSQYAAQYRTLDPQIGRWWQSDPKPDVSRSSYSSMQNNPILYSDPLGDTVRIRFSTGFLGLGKRGTVNYENGVITNTNGSNYTGKVTKFLQKTVDALNKLRNGGATGNKLVTDLQQSEKKVTIMNGTNSYKPFDTRLKKENIIRWNPDNTTGGADASLNTKRPAFIGLGHELAHAYDKVSDGILDPNTWYTPAGGDAPVFNAEIFATHIENLIRAENGVNLRAFYGLNHSSGTTVGEGVILFPGTRTNANFPMINNPIFIRINNKEVSLPRFFTY